MTVRAALAALEDAGVRWCIRNAPERVDALPPGSDIDVIVDERDVGQVARVLAAATTFRAFAAPGHRGHHFFLTWDAGRWWKLDVMVDAKVLANREREGALWVAAPADQDRHDAERAAGRPEPTWRERLARARPLSWRRAGPVVAIVGPDGAGKGTVIAALQRSLPVGATVARLGSARTGAPDPTPARQPSAAREIAFVARKWLQAVGRLAPAYAAAWRGHVVMCDRHPVEVLAIRPERHRLAAAVERSLLTRALPSPDATVVLDAPGAVLVARKPEHPVTTIDRWRAGYLALPDAIVVRSDTDPDATVAAVSRVLWDALAARRGWQ